MYAVRDAVEALIAKEGGKRISGIGADPTVGIADYSFPGAAEPDLFGTRADVHRLIGIDPPPAAFTNPGLSLRPADLPGNVVNVVVIRLRPGLRAHSAGPKGPRLATLPRMDRSTPLDRFRGRRPERTHCMARWSCRTSSPWRPGR